MNLNQALFLSVSFFFFFPFVPFVSFPFHFLSFILYISFPLLSFPFPFFYPVSHSVFLSLFPFISPSSPPSVPSFSLILYLLIFLSFHCYCSSLIQFCFTSFPLLSLASPSALSLSYSFLFILHLSLLLLLPSPFHSLLKNRKVDIRPRQLGVPPNHVFLFLLSLSILFYDVLLCVYFSFLIYMRVCIYTLYIDTDISQCALCAGEQPRSPGRSFRQRPPGDLPAAVAS